MSHNPTHRGVSRMAYAVKGIIITFREQNMPGCLSGENSDHFHCLRMPLLFNFSLMGECVSLIFEKSKVDMNNLAKA